LQAVCGDSNRVKLPLDRSNVELILDVAAGTGSWTLDVAQDPIIASRLLSPTDRLKLLACDLSLKKISPKLVSDSASNPRIQLFEQDITESFPAELRGTVDIVHMSLLVAALTEKGWQKALKNIFDVLSK
jgi:SAM-dependent methyltransferase